MSSPFRSRLNGLYIITDARLGGGHLPICRAALAGGARIIQLRDKTTPPRDLLKIALEMRELTRQNDAIFLINDRLDLALLCDADGVHLGPDDFPIAHVRRVLGPQKLIGASTATPAEALAAQSQSADYLGIGAVFGTSTKIDAGEAIGLKTLRAVLGATTLPAAAIGGLYLSNARSTIEAGAAMACVVSAVASAGDEAAMTRATRNLIAALDLGVETS
ncbi:MAG TPA: thiamine phosphate synthase [Abditibacterium sp.]|jgi:thiamine-phosphate diphosphorylase